MKKHILFLFVLLSLSASSQDFRKESKYVYGKYGLRSFPHKENYAEYNGKVFTYLPATPLLKEEEWQEFKGEAGQKYQIIEIRTKDEGTPMMDLILYYRADDGFVYNMKECMKDNIKFSRNKFYNYDKMTSIFQVPFVFMDEVNKDISDAIGKKLYREDIENQYEIVDAKFEMFNSSSKHKSVVYYVKDSKTGTIFRMENMNSNYKGIEDILFEKKNKISLVKVEKPSETTDRYGDITIVDFKDDFGFQFVDSIISIKVLPYYDKGIISDQSFIIESNKISPNCFAIEIKNKSLNTIKVIWDEAVFVGINSETSKVIHSGIKFSEKEKPQVPSTIIRGATLTDMIMPTDNIRYSEYIKDWGASPLFNNLEPISKPINMRIMLPIQIRDVVNEYILEFEVDYVYAFPYTKRK